MDQRITRLLIILDFLLKNRKNWNVRDTDAWPWAIMSYAMNIMKDYVCFIIFVVTFMTNFARSTQHDQSKMFFYGRKCNI